MFIIPAIDIKNSKCVRLTQGRMDAETVYSDNPVQVAKKWESMGAEVLHLVDLDGAVEGTPKNKTTISKISASIDVPVEIGGGIRDIHTIEYYLGCSNVKWLIIGTKAVEEKSFVKDACRRFSGRLAIGIDARDGFAATNGWLKVTSVRAVALAKMYEDMGAACIIYTDIKRDGMLHGPNINATEEMVNAVKMPVIASGGISSITDIQALKNINVYAAIIGKALYTGDVDLKEAIKTAKEE